MDEEVIKFRKKEILVLLTHLEYVVVSLDRIGSAGLPKEAMPGAIYNFIVEGNVFKRLAEMRQLILLQVDEDDSTVMSKAIEKALEKVQAWKPKN